MSWSDVDRLGAEAWFDRQMEALDDFATTIPFCFTPDGAGTEPHYMSPPRLIGELADFCARMVRRYGSTAVAPLAAPALDASARPGAHVEDHPRDLDFVREPAT